MVDNLKYALVENDNSQQIIYQDNVTGERFWFHKDGEYVEKGRFPFEEEGYNFVRWARGMDM